MHKYTVLKLFISFSSKVLTPGYVELFDDKSE